MKCDEFLPALETGGGRRRREARQHADHCPRCALVYVKWEATKRSLARPAPLSPHARDLWQRALRDGVTHPGRRIRLAPLVASLAAAACLLLVFVGPGLWRRGDQFGNLVPGGFKEVTSLSPTIVVRLDPRDELVELEDAVAELEAELESVRLIADRSVAQREILVTLNQYDRW